MDVSEKMGKYERAWRQTHGSIRRYVKSLKHNDWTTLPGNVHPHVNTSKVFQHLKHFSGYTLIIRKRSLKDKRYMVVLLDAGGDGRCSILIGTTPIGRLRWLDLDTLQLLETITEL